MKLKTDWVLAGAAALALIMVLSVSSLIYSARLARRLVTYNATVMSAEEQRKTLEMLLLESKNLKQAIDQVSGQGAQLRGLLGMPNDSKTAPVPAIVISDERKKEGDLRLPLLPDGKEISKNFQEIKLQVDDEQTTLDRLRSNIRDMRTRLAKTPSGWPLYGPIVSRYGWRASPWVGFHTGVDITAVYGAPIRCTASGVVETAGWRQGYGRAIVINHGNGLSTLYGHCSSLAVKSGQVVKRGQLIGYVGTSGFSTGPHLHYEVRRNDRPINPVAFLELKLFRAGASEIE